MKKVPYNRQTTDTPNPIARYAHLSREGHALAKVEQLLPPGGRVVDFGCGIGSFLNALTERRPEADLLGYDPGQAGSAESFARVSKMDAVDARSVDILCALEVLEHLSDQQLVSFINHATRVMKPGGAIVISVPIIGGLTLPLKELNRMILFRRKSDYSLSELLRASFLGVPAERPSDRGPTHKGFDFRALRVMLTSTFTLKSEDRSPFSRLPWWLNSQAFFVLTQRE